MRGIEINAERPSSPIYVGFRAILLRNRAISFRLSLMDNTTAEKRSALMSRVRNKDSKPEMLVRRLVHSMGYRYRLHAGRLPGRPDLVFPSRKKVIFVHGCFWHLHDCANVRVPKSRLDFWEKKLQGNRERDARILAKLTELGWSVLIIWECETHFIVDLKAKITEFLST